MRLLFVHSGSDLYGASRSLMRLSSRLVRDGHVVLVVLPYDGPLRPALEAGGVGVQVQLRLPVVTRQRVRSLRGLVSLLVDLPVSTLQLIGLIRKFRAEVIHTNTALILSPGWAARITGTPHIWHVREFFAEFGRLWFVYQWYMVWLADLIICVSSPVADQYYRRIRATKVRVIHNGFPASEFEPVAADRIARFKSQYGLTGTRLVGVIGRIKLGRKGQDVFVRAAAKLKDRYDDVRFLLIGSPFPGNQAHLESLMKLVAELGVQRSVVYTGDVADIQAAHAALDISVLASALPEPFGGVVIESMAFGRPVIGTAHGGTLEQVADQITGLLVPPGDESALAQAMARLLDDEPLRRRMGQAGRERFDQLFEFESFYKTMMSVYAMLTGVRPGPERKAAQ